MYLPLSIFNPLYLSYSGRHGPRPGNERTDSASVKYIFLKKVLLSFPSPKHDTNPEDVENNLAIIHLLIDSIHPSTFRTIFIHPYLCPVESKKQAFISTIIYPPCSHASYHPSIDHYAIEESCHRGELSRIMIFFLFHREFSLSLFLKYDSHRPCRRHRSDAIP